ncbi:MAG: hypothetical protein VYD39_06025, partial [Bacteroidota bacterium]|nr:hypothetical protein [Bacteroidota bacterium]
STKLSQIFNDTARALLLSQMNSHVEYQHFVSEYYALVDCLQLDSFMSTDDFAASKSLMLDFVQASIRGQVQTSLPVSTQALLKSRIWDIVKVQNAIDDSQVIAEVDKAAMIDTAIANMNPIIQQLWSLCVDVKPRVAASSSSVAAASMFLAAPATPMITIIHPPILMFSQRQQVNQGQQILYPLSGIQVDCNHPNHVQINTPDYVITLNDQLLPDQVTARVQEIANHSYINVDAQCQQIINSAIKQIDLEDNLNWLMQTDSYFTPDAQGQLFWYSIGNNALEAGFSSYSQKRALANNNYQITFDFNESGQVVAYDVFDKINRHLISDDVQKQSILFDMCACINRPQDNSQLLQLVTLS